MIDWKIWYADRSTFVGKPEDSPKDKGVVCISQPEQDDLWMGGDQNGVNNRLRWGYPIRVLRDGFFLPQKEFDLISHLARIDPVFAHLKRPYVLQGYDFYYRTD